MSNSFWTNVVTQMSSGITALAVSMTYYALVRKHAELDGQNEIDIAGDEFESDLKEKQDDINVESNDKHDISEFINSEKDQIEEKVAVVKRIVANYNLQSKMGRQSQIGTNIKKIIYVHHQNEDLNDSMMFKKMDNSDDIHIEGTKVKQDEETFSTNQQIDVAINKDLNQLKVKAKEDQDDSSFGASGSFPEPKTLPPVLNHERHFKNNIPELLQDCNCNVVTSSTRSSLAEPTNICSEYVTCTSWVGWPFKIFKAKYNSRIAVGIILILWLICALLSYLFLKFVYDSYDIEESQVPYYKIAFTVSKLAKDPNEHFQTSPAVSQVTDAPPEENQYGYYAWHW